MVILSTIDIHGVHSIYMYMYMLHMCMYIQVYNYAPSVRGKLSLVNQTVFSSAPFLRAHVRLRKVKSGLRDYGKLMIILSLLSCV